MKVQTLFSDAPYFPSTPLLPQNEDTPLFNLKSQRMCEVSPLLREGGSSEIHPRQLEPREVRSPVPGHAYGRPYLQPVCLNSNLLSFYFAVSTLDAF